MKIYLFIASTFIGLSIMFIVDIIQKFESILMIIILPFSCKLKSKKSLNRVINEWLHHHLYEDIFKLNQFEIDTFEK